MEVSGSHESTVSSCIWLDRCKVSDLSSIPFSWGLPNQVTNRQQAYRPEGRTERKQAALGNTNTWGSYFGSVNHCHWASNWIPDKSFQRSEFWPSCWPITDLTIHACARTHTHTRSEECFLSIFLLRTQPQHKHTHTHITVLQPMGAVTLQAMTSSEQQGLKTFFYFRCLCLHASHMHDCRRCRHSLIFLMPTVLWSSSVREYVAVRPSLYIPLASGSQDINSLSHATVH